MKILIPDDVKEPFFYIEIERGAGTHYHVFNNTKCIADVTFVGTGTFPHMIFDGPSRCKLNGEDSPNLDYKSLPEWKTSGLVDAEAMFEGCTFFDQPLKSWDVSNITNMDRMFLGCASLRQDLSTWKIPKDPSRMFNGCRIMPTVWMPSYEVYPGMTRFANKSYEYNSNNAVLDGSDKLVIERGNPFAKYCIKGPTDVTFSGKGPYPSIMFLDRCGATCILDGKDSPNSDYVNVSNWKITGLRSFNNMFAGCVNFNQPLNHWYLDMTTSMDYMFDGCTSFNQPLGNWITNKVVCMAYTFRGCTEFNQDLDNWCMAKVTNLTGMFFLCSSFDQELPNWNLHRYALTEYMFDGTPIPIESRLSIKQSRF